MRYFWLSPKAIGNTERFVFLKRVLSVIFFWSILKTTIMLMACVTKDTYQSISSNTSSMQQQQQMCTSESESTINVHEILLQVRKLRADESEPEDHSHLLTNGAKLKDILSALAGIVGPADSETVRSMEEENEVLTGQVAEMKAELQEVMRVCVCVSGCVLIL